MHTLKFLKAYVGSTLAVIASVCSILSLLLMFISSKLAVIIALCVLVIGLIALIVGILRGINSVIESNSKEPYRRLSSFYVYRSADGVKSTFEVYRTIQCKRMFLTSIPYQFKWTGSKVPVIRSKAQTIAPLRHVDDVNSWDSTEIIFPNPLKYNECTVINVETENDDSDNTAKPWISSKLDSPIDMMVYRVMLGYKSDDFVRPATFERKRIDTQIDGDYEAIESVSFDKVHKLYYYCAVNPEPGFIYRLRWEK